MTQVRPTLATLALLAISCAPSTRVGVRNDTSAPVSVILRTAESQTAMRFSDIGAQSASPLYEAQLSSLQSIVVEVRDGDGQSGRIDIRPGTENLVVVSLDRPPWVLVPGAAPPAETPAAAAPTPAAEPAPIAPAPRPDPPDAEPESPSGPSGPQPI